MQGVDSVSELSDGLEAMAGLLWRNITAMTGSWPDTYYFHRFAAAREADGRDRREWIEGVKQRLGIVTIGDPPAADPVWPEGLPDGQWEVISDHTLELPLGWPPDCLCVISDGEQVSLGGPCPAHSGAGGVSTGEMTAPSKKVVYCSGDLAISRLDYSQPGHPRRVHEDGTLCDHPGPIRIGDA